MLTAGTQIRNTPYRVDGQVIGLQAQFKAYCGQIPQNIEEGRPGKTLWVVDRFSVRRASSLLPATMGTKQPPLGFIDILARHVSVSSASVQQSHTVSALYTVSDLWSCWSTSSYDNDQRHAI